jgi:hypothetical protein
VEVPQGGRIKDALIGNKAGNLRARLSAMRADDCAPILHAHYVAASGTTGAPNVV